MMGQTEASTKVTGHLDTNCAEIATRHTQPRLVTKSMVKAVNNKTCYNLLNARRRIRSSRTEKIRLQSPMNHFPLHWLKALIIFEPEAH